MNRENFYYVTILLNFIESIDKATNSIDIIRIFMQTISPFGFTNLVISDLPLSYENIEDVICFDELPEGWPELYATRKYARCDPVARMCRNTFRAFDWKEAPYDRERESRAGELMALARDFGMLRGFCVPVPGFAHRTACISMSGRHSELPVRAKPALQFIAIYTAEKVRQVVGAARPPVRSPLTMREREVLRWAAVGKTANDVAEILNITERTVTAHTVSAMNKLGAANKTQAVARAMQCQFIPVDL
ncbi:transcriptional regulator [Phyllobacterium phragmitis]|uniref:Transcriptional regulator n=1 Tax=Phyllobacterium phragmitis TaxID=2670329 RepID=A0A2S9IPG2_9HYPH|nr:LuxR family transcriptional regulator [Phyllobacterium phragmitis]PRD42413.1 transcriptional regulator [Phyllobacterium phragmitis]